LIIIRLQSSLPRNAARRLFLSGIFILKRVARKRKEYGGNGWSPEINVIKKKISLMDLLNKEGFYRFMSNKKIM
jgi:hypothetical protein